MKMIPILVAMASMTKREQDANLERAEYTSHNANDDRRCFPLHHTTHPYDAPWTTACLTEYWTTLSREPQNFLNDDIIRLRPLSPDSARPFWYSLVEQLFTSERLHRANTLNCLHGDLENDRIEFTQCKLGQDDVSHNSTPHSPFRTLRFPWRTVYPCQ